MAQKFGADELGKLFQFLAQRGYQVLGPTVRDGAVVYDEITGVGDLPRGLTDEQDAGRYRLKPRADGAYFGYASGPQSWKKYLHPAEVKLFEADQKGGSSAAVLVVGRSALATLLVANRREGPSSSTTTWLRRCSTPAFGPSAGVQA